MRYCEQCRASFQALRTCPRDRAPTRADVGDPLIGHVLGDRYRILERIAAGGMGQIYRAAHTRIASLFAVKVLYGDIAHDPSMRTRFQREAEAASCLQSRYIVRVVDFSESPEGLLYLAMEHLDGVMLSGVIKRDGRLAPDHAIAVAQQIARGLAHAHERGVIHRDLKTDNVMLVLEDDAEVVKLLDFGVARIRSESNRLTQVGQVVGTPQYMAPEQFTSGEVDARADLYALGVILYEMITGLPPFDSKSILELARLHASAPPRSLRERNPAVEASEELELVIQRLLAKHAEDRYPSARALLEALRGLGLPSLRRTSGAVPVENPVEASIADRIRAAIYLGAPTYNAGDHEGCFRIYHKAAEDLLVSAIKPDTALAASARLRSALRRADATGSPTLAAWEMRYAFDDILHVAESPTPTQVGDGPLSGELAVAEAIAAPRYAAGHLELVGDYYLEFARQLSDRLRRVSNQAAVCAYLDNAVAMAMAAGGGQRALATLGRVIEALRRGLYPTAPAGPAVTSILAESCPRLEEYAGRIVKAVSLGAPAYNAGDPGACYRIYRQTAEGIVSEIGAHEGCALVAALLRGAIEDAARLDPDDAAWTLRHAFDTLLAAAGQPAGLPSASAGSS